MLRASSNSMISSGSVGLEMSIVVIDLAAAQAPATASPSIRKFRRLTGGFLIVEATIAMKRVASEPQRFPLDFRAPYLHGGRGKDGTGNLIRSDQEQNDNHQ